ncbi:hypothetical protein OG470_30405 [Micromonospora sp. NBC_00389]|uniref:hypothetical protein n=1 Tax=Micromonospora sp. NBC_00389 TaxID=2903586 RepID=UPI002E1CC236
MSLTIDQSLGGSAVSPDRVIEHLYDALVEDVAGTLVERHRCRLRRGGQIGAGAACGQR